MTSSELNRILTCIDDAVKICDDHAKALTVGEIRIHSSLLEVRMQIAAYLQKEARVIEGSR